MIPRAVGPVTDVDDSSAPRRATFRFMAAHPARWIALGFGCGLSPWAPGTVGTLWGWLAFLVLDRWLDDLGWAVAIGAGVVVGWWACTRTVRDLRCGDPGAIVWDEILAIWIVLWLLMPAGFWVQAAAFGVFRLLDATKPGPIGWADRAFKARPGRPLGAREGFGVLLDDGVAALCTLVVFALWTWI